MSIDELMALACDTFGGDSWDDKPGLRAAVEAFAREQRERCAKEAEHWQKIGTTSGHACGQYIAAAIRSL